jgi:hypothetical protein
MARTHARDLRQQRTPANIQHSARPAVGLSGRGRSGRPHADLPMTGASVYRDWLDFERPVSCDARPLAMRCAERSSEPQLRGAYPLRAPWSHHGSESQVAAPSPSPCGLRPSRTHTGARANAYEPTVNGANGNSANAFRVLGPHQRAAEDGRDVQAALTRACAVRRRRVPKARPARKGRWPAPAAEMNGATFGVSIKSAKQPRRVAPSRKDVAQRRSTT